MGVCSRTWFGNCQLTPNIPLLTLSHLPSTDLFSSMRCPSNMLLKHTGRAGVAQPNTCCSSQQAHRFGMVGPGANRRALGTLSLLQHLDTAARKPGPRPAPTPPTAHHAQRKPNIAAATAAGSVRARMRPRIQPAGTPATALSTWAIARLADLALVAWHVATHHSPAARMLQPTRSIHSRPPAQRAI